MKLMIPTIGVVLELTRAWTFCLVQEGRNFEFSKKVGAEWRSGYSYGNEPATVQVTLPEGSRLTVDRIYIRSGGKDIKKFDSVTFRLNSHTRSKKVLKGRFWARLSDVNRIEAEVDYTTWPGLSEMEVLAMVANDPD